MTVLKFFDASKGNPTHHLQGHSQSQPRLRPPHPLRLSTSSTSRPVTRSLSSVNRLET
jgi:hypothetical protein